MRRHESRSGETRRDRGGFTLIEVIVAMAIAVAVLLGARLTIEELGMGAERITRAARSTDSDANGERLLRQLVGDLEIGTADTLTFTGNEQDATFWSWCRVPGGWQERCRVRLSIEARGDSAGLVVHLGPADSLDVLARRAPIALRYLDDAGAGGHWVPAWGQAITPPLAIGLVFQGDTLVLRVGDRG